MLISSYYLTTGGLKINLTSVFLTHGSSSSSSLLISLSICAHLVKFDMVYAPFRPGVGTFRTNRISGKSLPVSGCRSSKELQLHRSTVQKCIHCANWQALGFSMTDYGCGPTISTEWDLMHFMPLISVVNFLYNIPKGPYSRAG